MTQMNLLLHKIHKKEHEHFLKSLEEKDEWEAKATEYITRRNNELGQISEDCRYAHLASPLDIHLGS